MGRLGFEPRTNRLKAECSTAELATLKLVQFCSAYYDNTLIRAIYTNAPANNEITSVTQHQQVAAQLRSSH